MTAVGRPDNGQDEGLDDRDLTPTEVLVAGILLDPLDGCDVPWPTYKLIRDGIAQAFAEQRVLASARPRAGEQQRVARWLSDRYGARVDPLDHFPGHWLRVADELLALLAHTDEETR